MIVPTFPKWQKSRISSGFLSKFPGIFSLLLKWLPMFRSKICYLIKFHLNKKWPFKLFSKLKHFPLPAYFSNLEGFPLIHSHDQKKSWAFKAAQTLPLRSTQERRSLWVPCWYQTELLLTRIVLKNVIVTNCQGTHACLCYQDWFTRK